MSSKMWYNGDHFIQSDQFTLPWNQTIKRQDYLPFVKACISHHNIYHLTDKRNSFHDKESSRCAHFGESTPELKIYGLKLRYIAYN